RANCRRYPDADTAEAALAELVNAGLARWTTPETSMRGGLPVKAIELCMTHDTDDTDPGDDDDGDPPTYDTSPDTALTPRPTPGEDVPRQEVTPVDGSGVSGVMRHAQDKVEGPEANGTAEDLAGAGGCHAPPGPMSGAPSYLLVRDAAHLLLARNAA